MSKATEAASHKEAASARSEVSGEQKTLEFKGETFTLPAKLPFNVLPYLNDNPGSAEIVGVLKTLLGQEQLDKVWAMELDIDEGTQLMNDLVGEYGLDLGESEASASS